ncbi:MAG: TetR/AcrR family transcriptional regulator [Burkholderiaceae bacterium]|nr:TetR/AcrR family transcriptional regulator [Burkholderiaceae bacterium]
MTNRPHPSRVRLLEAALRLIRTKGYAATTVDDVCEAAGVTKGSFFHHFKGKEDLAIAATAHWNEATGGVFAGAPYRGLPDPRERVLGYIDYRAALLTGELPDFTCLLGTMVQETFETHPAIREACRHGIELHAGTVAADLAEAKAKYVPEADWSPESVALYTQAVLQGAFILAKATGGPTVAIQCVDQLKRHVASLLTPDPERVPA